MFITYYILVMNKVVLLRHGQSQWNLENRFTGWKDVPLTDEGIREAQNAGNLIKKNNIILIKFTATFYKEQIKQLKIAMKEAGMLKLFDKDKLIYKRMKA